MFAILVRRQIDRVRRGRIVPQQWSLSRGAVKTELVIIQELFNKMFGLVEDALMLEHR